MTIYQVLKLIQDGNTAALMFDQRRFQSSLYIYVNGVEFGQFDNPTDFEIAVRNEYNHEFATKLLTAELAPVHDPWKAFHAIDQETGEVLARVEMYDKN